MKTEYNITYSIDVPHMTNYYISNWNSHFKTDRKPPCSVLCPGFAALLRWPWFVFRPNWGRALWVPTLLAVLGCFRTFLLALFLISVLHAWLQTSDPANQPAACRTLTTHFGFQTLPRAQSDRHNCQYFGGNGTLCMSNIDHRA